MPLPNRPHIIGVTNNAASLETALTLAPGQGIDFIELRLDAFHPDVEPLWEALPKLPLPTLITARHPAEGGHGDLDLDTRRALLAQFLPHATLMDLELRSTHELPELISQARHLDKHVVLSFHDFRGTPRVELLEDLAQEAIQRGAHVFKVAVTANDLPALTRMIRFAQRAAEQKLPLALMAMGKYGMVSRLLMAQHGSLLNYGSLGGTPVPGQWPARDFAERLREILPE